MVRSSQALRCLQRQSALHTLTHQSHPAPSCGGHAPTAKRTVDPARKYKKINCNESLTADPELENSLGQKRYRDVWMFNERTAIHPKFHTPAERHSHFNAAL